VIGFPTEKKPNPRDDYEPFIEKAKEQIGDFVKETAALNFVPSKVNFKTCYQCDYLCVCRAVYSLNPVELKSKVNADTDRNDGEDE
jgi:hypothetical protein